MNKIGQFFSDVKRNMPRRAQWILLAISAGLILMLAMMLTGNKPGQKTVRPNDDMTLNIQPKEIDFGNVLVGDSKEETFTIRVKRPTIISGMEIDPAVPGMSNTDVCQNMGQIMDKLPCEVKVIFKPEKEAGESLAVLNIKYYDATESKDMERSESVQIRFSSSAEAWVDPVIIEEPVARLPEPEPEPEDEPEPEPVVHVPTVAPQKEPEYTTVPPKAEECYQFAFAGYNNAGKQIGWIKPEGGHYMFHPFSDKNCNSPTGEYDTRTGMISDLKDPSKKIGSDAEHIGGRGGGINLTMPTLSNPAPTKQIYRAVQLDNPPLPTSGPAHVFEAPEPQSSQRPSSLGKQATLSSVPYDRTFVLRHFKPIPATIVNEIRAVENAGILPVMATVDRHVYSDNGRTIVVPAGTLMLGNVRGNLPGPYKTIGRIEIEWYRFIRPDGVEFNFESEDNRPFSGDSQGRIGVPGYGSSDYLEQMVLPMLTAIVPAVTNLIAPVSDKIVNQIDLDRNVIVQSGQMRSSEMAKQQMIQSWNKVTEKLFIDMLDNTKPPFSIASGTRITVYSPTDLVVVWCESPGNCTPAGLEPSTEYAAARRADRFRIGEGDPESIYGQVAAYISDTGQKINDIRLQNLMKGFELYQSKSMAANAAYAEQLKNAGGIMRPDGSVIKQGSPEYNQEILKMKYATGADGNQFLLDPSASKSASGPAASTTADDGVMCDGGVAPGADGCCPGETLTDMGAEGMNCCPDAGGDCFPPIR